MIGLVVVLALSLFVAPLAAGAQQSAKVPRIGILWANSSAIAAPWAARTLREVQEALGHQTITMTMRYSHLAPDHLRAAVAVLDDMLPSLQLAESATASAQASAQEPVPAGEVSQKSW